MYIKREVKNLVVYVKCQQDAETSGNVRAVEYYGKFVQRSLERINRWANMAQAALAYAEFQIDDDREAPMDEAYFCKRIKLWDAFMAAREKAKGMNNGST